MEKVCGRPSVGVIGLGLMEEVFSRRLIDGGQSVVGYDIDAAKVARLADMGGRDLGGRAAASIAEVARACDPIVLAVFDTSQVEDVVENHILPAVGEGSRKIVLCASTCDPDRIASLGERVIPRGIRFLETPVSGTSEQVRRGDGVGLIGGNRDTAAEVEPVLAILFPRRFDVGHVGDGGRTSSLSILSSASTAWRSPKGWYSPRASDSILRRFSRWRRRPLPIRRSWMCRVPR